MPIYTEDVEVILGKKQPPPVTSTSTGQAVTPPTTSTPVVATGAFGPPPIVSKQPTVPATQPATFLMKGPTGQIDPTTAFWANLGAPQYIGRYAPFAIPTGYKVSGMVEQNGQLLVSFESTARGVSPSLMKNLEAFAVQANQDQPSTVQVSEVSPMLMTRKLQGPVEDAQNLFDPQAAVSEENTGYQKLHLGSAIPDGLPAPTFTLTTIATKQAAQVDQPFEQFPETGDPNDLVSWLNSQRTIGPNGNVIIPSESIQKPTLEEAYQQYHDVRMPGLLAAESSTFYTSIGYPQYGGKYAPFTIPEGAAILSITATPLGLQVMFKLPPQTQTQTAIIGKSPLNVGQTVTIQRQPLPDVIPSLTAWLLGQSKVAAKFEQFMVPSPMKSAKGLETIAGFVASGESLINPRTPFIVSPSFIGGYIFGAAVLGYGIGKVVQPIVQPLTQAITEPVQSKATAWLTKSYEESLSAGKLWEPSTTERIVMGITRTTPKALPPSIIGLPTLIEEGTTNLDLISYSELPAARATKVGGDISIATYKQLPSLIAGEDIFEFTNAPRTMGFGLTVPTPELTQVAATASLETFGLPAPALSSIVAKWFTPIDEIPKQELSFTKQPQTYRPAEESALSFSKQFGELPTKSGLLQQITMQEAKAVATSSGMPNVFGPAVQTIQKTATPFIPITLGEMTSWLVSQETQTKTVQASAITPLTVTFQPQGKTQQIDETQYLTYPGQPLTVNVPTRETKETVVSPILDLGAMIAIGGKQGVESVQSLPLLEKQVQQITQPQKSLISNVLISPLLESAVIQEQRTVSPLLTLSPLLSPLTESDISINLFPNVTPEERVTPFATQIITPGLSIPSPTPTKSIFVPPRMSPVVTPKLFTLPKSGMGGLGPREPMSLLYPFGRQKRKYPVMTGGQAAKFLFSGKIETKRRKKK